MVMGMNRRRTGDLKFIQELNRSIIFETIRKEGPISRSELAKRHLLSPTTVTSAVNELIKNGLIKEGEFGTSSGGRKPIMLSFAPDSRFIIGVSITNTMIKIGQLNMEPQIKQMTCYPVDRLKEQRFLEYFLDCLGEFIDQLTNIDDCNGIAVVVPGVVDYESGTIQFNSELGLHHIPLRDMIESRFQIKTWIDNDTNALALAEKEIGTHRKVNHLIYIMLGDGVGSGIVLNNKVFRGAHGGAGEFGHILVERNGIRCKCGNRGCLENYVSWSAIHSRIVTAISTHQPTQIIDMIDKDLSKITPELFHQAIDQGDPIAINILDDLTSYLVTGLVNIINLFDPEVVILGGKVVAKNHHLIASVNEKLAEQGMKPLNEKVVLSSSSLREDEELMAAAAVSIHEQFTFSYS